jgi:hypothetical protein
MAALMPHIIETKKIELLTARHCASKRRRRIKLILATPKRALATATSLRGRNLPISQPLAVYLVSILLGGFFDKMG